MDFENLVNDLKTFFTNELKRDKLKNEFFVTELVTCAEKKNHYKSDLPAIFGNIIHHSVEDFLRKKGCQTEVDIRTKVGDYIVSGRVDALCDGIVVEIKTAAKPTKEYINQVRLYNYILGNTYGYLLLVNRSNFSLHRVDGAMDKMEIISLIAMYNQGNLIHQFDQCDECFFNLVCNYSKVLIPDT